MTRRDRFKMLQRRGARENQRFDQRIRAARVGIAIATQRLRELGR